MDRQVESLSVAAFELVASVVAGDVDAVVAAASAVAIALEPAGERELQQPAIVPNGKPDALAARP